MTMPIFYQYEKPKIVADTSVWIDYFNNKSTAHCDFLYNALLTHKVIVFDVILMEVLQGFNNQKSYENAKSVLLGFENIEIMNQQNAIIYADYYRELRKKGITIRKSNDVMIAGFCIQNHLPLLFSDRDFLPFCEHYNLQSAL